MKAWNALLLAVELYLCYFFTYGFPIIFGHGEGDVYIYLLFYCGVGVHLIWTLVCFIRKRQPRIALVIFSVMTVTVMLLASVLRGPVWPWDGSLRVDRGPGRPGNGKEISYLVTEETAHGDSVLTRITLPDPGDRYSTTLRVQDHGCTGCEEVLADSGAILVPDTLKRFKIMEGYESALWLTGRDPNLFTTEPYLPYRVKGQVVGVRDEKLVFYVTEWEELDK